MNTHPDRFKETSPVAPGARVTLKNGTSVGAIGAFLKPQGADTIYGVTTAVVVGAKREEPILLEQSGQFVGTALPIMSASDTFLPSYGLLGLVMMESPIAWLPSDENVDPIDLQDPLGTLSQIVTRGRGPAAPRGRVITVDATAAVRTRPDAALRTYGGLIEVTDIDMEFADDECGGEAVFGGDGSLLGLVVGGVAGRTFVAPLQSLLEDLDLRLAVPLDIEQHNERLRLPQEDPHDLPQVSAPLSLAGFDKYALLIAKTPQYYAPVAAER
jgi:hypothetical protein